MRFPKRTESIVVNSVWLDREERMPFSAFSMQAALQAVAKPGTPMSLHIKALHDGALQVENDTGHWLIFSLDELRSHSVEVGIDRIEGASRMPADKADLFAWAAFAAARGYAIEHGLLSDDRPSQSPGVTRL